jgi:MFS family permease
MRAIELGRPLDDTAVARSKALGAIGVAVPVVSMSAGVVGSCIALGFGEPLWRFAAFFVNWIVCGAVCVTVVPLLVHRMRVPPPSAESPDPDDR